MAENKKKIPSKEANENKQKALDATISTIEKQFGKGSIMRLDNESSVKNVDAISTGSIALDHALGVGGFPRGRVIEVYGPEASGKTTLALHAIAETQRSGGITAFVVRNMLLTPLMQKAWASRTRISLYRSLITENKL